MTSGEAKRLWRQSIKEHHGNRCMYCGSDENLTLDHLRPKARGGQDVAHNLVTACRRCNQDKGTDHWLSWYSHQDSFNLASFHKILAWAS